MDKGEAEKIVSMHRHDHQEETIRYLQSSGPLFRRGWALQESIASPRQLYYGHRQSYCPCAKGYEAADESSADFNETVPYVTGALYRNALSSVIQPSNLQFLVSEYCQSSEMYSGRNLTMSCDELPAFSGISSHLAPTLGNYLVGL